jgi:hypothetical protein
MKKYITLAIVLVTITVHAQLENSLSNEEISVLNNTQWAGELMYLDYSTGKETTLKTNMQITTKNNKITMNTQYVYEPSANNKNTIKLKKNGTYFGNEKIIEKTVSKDGITTIITVFKGSDNNKPATLFKTYIFSGTAFSVTKEVQFENTKEKLVRNRVTYTKI